MLTNLESTSVRIVRPPRAHLSPAGLTGSSSLSPQQQAPTASSPPTFEESCGPSPDNAGGPRMATIQEDISDSHLGEEGPHDAFTTAGASSSATRFSYEGQSENPPRDRRRLQRQERIDTKETEC